jgi:hypothetical protein
MILSSFEKQKSPALQAALMTITPECQCDRKVLTIKVHL